MTATPPSPNAPTRDTTCFVICADGFIFDLLVGLLLSLRGVNRARYKIGLIDVGLSGAQRDHLLAHGLCDGVEPIDEARLVPLDPRLEARIAEKSPFWRAQACRPFLREYFPGHARYVHLDADMWVQRPEFFDELVKAMDAGNAVIVPEADVGYKHMAALQDNMTYFNGKAYVVRQSLGDVAAQETAALPFLNTGLFGMRHDHPHWRRFLDELTALYRRGFHHLTEQLAFNVVILRHGAVTLFPAQCNWMCSWAPPVRRDDGVWCSPAYPYAPLDLLHLTGTDKFARYSKLGLLYDDGRYLDGIAHLLPPR